MDFSSHMSIVIAPLFVLPLLTALFYLSSVCPIKPHCFLLTTSPRAQTLYCESSLTCSTYRCLLTFTTVIALVALVIGLAWFATISSESDLVEDEEVASTRNGWSEDLIDEDTDCEEDGPMTAIFVPYRD